MQENPIDIYTTFERLKLRKGLYLGTPYDFNCLDSFISGFMLAASERQLEFKDYPSFKYFNTWMIGHLRPHLELSVGWHLLITNKNNGNDDKCFEDFFYFLEVFKNSKMYSRTMLVDEEAIAYSKTSGVRRSRVYEGVETPINNQPFKIVWKSIANSTTVWLDYVDEDGNIYVEDSWFVEEEAAMDSLKTEFGHFKEQWQ